MDKSESSLPTSERALVVAVAAARVGVMMRLMGPTEGTEALSTAT